MLWCCHSLTTTLGGNVTDFTRADVEVLDRQTGFKGFYRLDVLTLRHRLFNGGWGPSLRTPFVCCPMTHGWISWY